MTDRKACVRCERQIDGLAKTCVYCNWDQNEAAPARVDAPAAAAPTDDAGRASARPRFHLPRNRIVLAIGGAAILVIAFVVGSLVHGFEPSEVKTTTAVTTTEVPKRSEPAPKANIDLVADGGSAPGDQPITSAPQVTASDEYQRDDATALASTDYAQLAQRARAAQPQAQPGFVDPRTVGATTSAAAGAAAGAAPPVRDVPMASSAAPRRVTRTEPIPVYQPVPSLHVGNASTRLYLTVGSDGRVKDIDITKPIPGETPRLIGAVQNWRFRPATENGVPVAARFSVDITFHDHE